MLAQMMQTSAMPMRGLETDMSLTFGVAALARPTFDVPYAEEMAAAAFKALDEAGITTVGPRELLFDADMAEQALSDIKAADVDLLLLMQVTFTDATMTVKLAQQTGLPTAIWAFPEPRAGGRLRLNAFCGLNLAAHALGKAGSGYGWLFAGPDSPNISDRLKELASPISIRPTAASVPATEDNAAADRVLAALSTARIGVVGKHPDGFDTCEYDGPELKDLVGIEVDSISTDALFDRARNIDAERVAGVKAAVADDLAGLDAVDQEQLDKSFRVFCALEDVQQEQGASSLAVRCWPETFTEYGCAACGPMAMMNQKKVPCACEADVYGSLSALMLQELSGEPSWMADLVDVDTDEDTAVFWHCGLAPLSMKDPEAEAEATIHTNRKMPLLHQFPLKPGRVTLARISQSRNEKKMMIAGAEFVRAPMAFTGTSGVVKFDKPAGEVLETVMEEGLEHHYAIAYGEHRPALRAIAAKLDIPVLELT